MTAACTIALLFTFSFVVVRVAAVAMRHTGLPENVARFQCVSALTGTGYTTSESETIVNYPVRRRIILSLMVFGNLGLVSVSATFIVSFLGTAAEPGATTRQVVMFLLAIGVTLLVMANKKLDRAMCDMMARILLKVTSVGKTRYQTILLLDNGYSIAEHINNGANSVAVGDLSLSENRLNLITIRGKKRHGDEPVGDDAIVSSGEALVVYGKDDGHKYLESCL
jgi:hypothetical protein